MEEELLKEYVGTYLNPKYNGDWDLINSKFPELSGVDKELLKEYVGTYLNPKYNSDWSVVNSKFPELFQAGETSSEPVKKKDTASASVAGTATTPDHKVIIMGKQALLEATTYEPKTVIGPIVDELNRFRSVGWKYLGGWNIYRPEARYIITCESSI